MKYSKKRIQQKKRKKYRSTKCLNCNTTLDHSEAYCHRCGQLNSTKRINLYDFFEEFIANFYAYDSKLRNSIVSIFTRPGILAKEYNNGKKQSYANPFRLFLNISLLLFLSFSISDFFTKEQELIENSKEKPIKANKKNQFSKDSIYNFETIKKQSLGFDYKISSFKNFHTKHPTKTDTEALKELGYEATTTNKFIYHKSQSFKSNNIYDEMIDFFYSKLPLLIFLSLPIISLMFLILYIRNNVNYTEHLIFTYTFFTFIFIIFIFINLIDIISSPLSLIFTGIFFLLVFPIYFYRSLRNFYQQNRWKTIIKFLLLIPMFSLFLTISIVIMTFLGILFF